MLIILSNSNTCGPTKSNTKYCGKRGQQIRIILVQVARAVSCMVQHSVLLHRASVRCWGCWGAVVDKAKLFPRPDMFLPWPRPVFYSTPCMVAQYLLHKCPWASVWIRRYCQKGQEAQGNAKHLLVLEVVLALFVINWNKHMSRKGWNHEIVEKGVEAVGGAVQTELPKGWFEKLQQQWE